MVLVSLFSIGQVTKVSGWTVLGRFYSHLAFCNYFLASKVSGRYCWWHRPLFHDTHVPLESLKYRQSITAKVPIPPYRYDTKHFLMIPRGAGIELPIPTSIPKISDPNDTLARKYCRDVRALRWRTRQVDVMNARPTKFQQDFFL